LGAVRVACHEREAVTLDPDCSEHVEPDQHVNDGSYDGRSYELANGAAAGDLSDEGADERRPGDPPAPLEDGPAVHEVLLVCDVVTWFDVGH